MGFNRTFYNLLKETSLVFWAPFQEAFHATGYSPNVADETDASVNRLTLSLFTPPEGAGDGDLFMIPGLPSGNTQSPITSALQITGDLTIIIWYRWIDDTDASGWLVECSGTGETEATNMLYAVQMKTTSELMVKHEYGAGNDEYNDTGVIYPRDGRYHMLMVRRDASAKTYEISVDNGAKTVINYTNSPTGGTSAEISVGGKVGWSAGDGQYSDVFIMDELLSDDQVSEFYSSGQSRDHWFDYSNWDSATGAGYVTWVLSSEMNVLDENLYIFGKHLDAAEDSANLLLEEAFADETDTLLEDFERVFNLSRANKTVTERRNSILSAMRARGNLDKNYFEDLGNTLGDGEYTVSIAEGSDNIGFIVHTYSENTTPRGPGTVLPGRLEDAPFADNPYNITVTVTGVASADELEALFNRLKPAWTQFNYTYVP